MERQTIFHELTEKRVEQSFNEQLFAFVLDYRTLLSHEPGEFHLLPQNFAGGKRYDDFSLGLFGTGDAEPRVLASAEFKSPGCDLDRPQTSGRYGGKTPVQQALEAAKAHPTCLWALVSNFCELRLYRLDLDEEVARANLLTIRTRQDLAELCAHFDRTALIGDGRKELPEMTIAMADDHPVQAFKREKDAYRVQWLFTPTGDTQLALYEIEKRLRLVVQSTVARELVALEFDEEERLVFNPIIRNGWVVAEGKPQRLTRTRFGVSRYGQVALSLIEPVSAPPSQTYHAIQRTGLNRAASLFARLVSLVIGPQAVGVGAVEVSLSDLKDDAKPFEWANTRKRVSDDVVDARWDCCDSASPPDIAAAIAHCICELAIYFRDDDGGVLLEHAEESKSIETLAFTP